MARAFSRRRVLMIVPGILLALALMPPFAAVSSASSSREVAAAVTTTTVSYRFDGQLVSGSHAGTSLYGWVGGSLDSTGVLTATLTVNALAPLKAGCAPYVDFGPACGLAPTANVGGMLKSSGANLTAKGKGWTWTLVGSGIGLPGWTGSIIQAGVSVGSFTLTAQPNTVHIDAAIKSDAKSTDKIVLVGAIDLQVTASGWAVGTYAPVNGSLPTLVQGYINSNKGSGEVSIPMGSKGTILVTAYTKPGFGNLHWIGTFVGPAMGDFGTFAGQG